MTYALLKNPAHTRVSYQDSDILAVNELMVLTEDLSTDEIRPVEIGGVTYVLFDCDRPLDESIIRTLSRLSFVYAVFELHGDLLKPVVLNADYFIDQELSGILKYSGKTNELFTRLMLNLAQFYMKNPPEVLNILDPLAGKGTTLFEALIQGHNAYGVEVDEKVVHESVVYVKKYLETVKYKHETHTEKISGQSIIGKFTSSRNQVTIARSKQEEKQGNVRHFEILDGDTRNVSILFKKNHFHAIVADLPYGVQHGSKTGAGKKQKPQGSAITRNALGLISEAMPGWVRVLKPGGVIVLAWNLFLITREEMAELLTEHGFTVPDTEVDFSHRVDQAIDRDLIVGVLG
ncbi:MAG: SAM-dependent methyltransferase [Firmicutes bacterium]|nr:SAM-dependent methyltransferase [Bacillota bacterium]